MVDNLRKFADDALKKIRPIDPNAIVAGGAPRDWFLGRTPSDIDLFVYCSKDRMGITTFGDLLGGLFTDVDEVKLIDPSDSQYKMNPYLSTVHDLRFVDKHLQIMRMDRPTYTSVVQEFPLSISKIWYKDGKIIPHHHFLEGGKYNAIFRTQEGYADTNRYIAKILNKFPEMNYFHSREKFLESLLVLED